MTFYSFRLLLPMVQVYWVLKYSTYLAQRWESQGRVNIYHCADDGRGFFVEIGAEEEKPVVLRSFVSSVPLEDYSHYVQLPEL